MGLYNRMFGGGTRVQLDTEKSDDNKRRMRNIFNSKVKDGDQYKLIFGYSENIGETNFSVLSTVAYKYRNFIIGYRESDLTLVLIEIEPDLNESGDPITLKSEDLKRADFDQEKGSYYIQYGSTFRKHFFDIFVPKTVDEINNQDYFDQDTFLYIDQSAEHDSWVSFWDKYSK